MNVDFAINFYNTCLNVCKKDEYNILLSKHLGDLVYIIQVGLNLEKQKGFPVHFILNPNHEFLMKMFNITNYTLLNLNYFKNELKERVKFDQDVSEDIQRSQKVSIYQDFGYITSFSTIPIKGIPIVPDSLLINFCQYPYYWARRWFAAFGLNEFQSIKEPQNYPMLSKEKMQLLERVAPLNKMVLFAPEALTAVEFNPRFWEILIKEIQNKGYTVFINSNDEKYLFKNTYSVYDYDLSLEDVIAFGMQCAYVFSLRSGLSDVLVGKHSKMYCFYPASMEREKESLNTVFKLDEEQKVNEILIKKYGVPHIIFENKDISIDLNKFVKQQKFKRLNFKILRMISFNKQKKKLYKTKIKQLKDLYGKCRKNNNEELINQ